MNYQETLDWMFSQLPMYQRQGKAAFKKDLTNILAFTKELGNPQTQFKSIHVGGTNGKGSTSHMIASILQEAGYKVGLYTSPHLKNFTERIRVDGEEISRDKVISFISNNKKFLEKQALSFFEMTVGLAFDYFACQKVDVAIIEVGLGGRLDSTNIITPELSVITNIGLDHTQFLGDTLSEVAFEKAGIIKNGIPVVVGEYHEDTLSVFSERAKLTKSKLIKAYESSVYNETDLLGSYQKRNVTTAVNAVKNLSSFKVLDVHIEKGLLNVVNNTHLKGRWQLLGSNPKIVCDTAHNKEGLKYVLKQLQEEDFESLHIVLGMVSDKNIDEILPMFPRNATYYFCKPSIPRGLCEEVLAGEAIKLGFTGKIFSSVKQAFLSAQSLAKESDMIFVGGSTFVVSEII